MSTESHDSQPAQSASSADPGLEYLGPRSNMGQEDLAASDQLEPDLPVPGAPLETPVAVAGGDDPDLDATHNVLTGDGVREASG